MKFQSKAQTLQTLRSGLRSATVLPQCCFTVLQWNDDPDALIELFFTQHEWAISNLVVRSSAMAEDADNESLAGHFESILNVRGRRDLKRAITAVIASFYGDNPSDQVFIQPMLQDVARSGVVFTKEPSTNSPYYVINYSQCGSTESVTSGAASNALIYLAKCGQGASQEQWVPKLIALCAELEAKFCSDSLDIEFAFDQLGQLYLFQVRALIINVSPNNALSPVSPQAHQKLLQRVKSSIERLTKPHPYLNGARSVLGVMPDWNPAEIIGIRPNPLALSLYKELVTDSTWAYQRNNYGYKQLRSFPLLVSLAGLPYIDVRVSFNSFVPADISDQLAEKLVNFYIEQLENSPEKHDKIEFDVIFSCYTLDVEQRLAKLLQFGFTQDEITSLSESLKKLTNNIINPDGLWVKDIIKIESLPDRRKKILDSELTKIEKIYWLLEDCKRYGTLPFAGLARAGFIAVQFLKSLVTDGILTQTGYDDFMRSLETVSSTMAKDRAELSFNAFLAKYGHLRPGTYDILSPRYDQASEKYFDPNSEQRQYEVCEDFSLSLKQLEKLKSSLDLHGIEHDVISLFRFIKGAIEGREYAKFVFSQSLSDAIFLIEQLGDELGLSKNEMAFLDISVLYKAYSSADDIVELVQNAILSGKKQYQQAQSLILPPLIVSADDVYCFKMPEGEPNFITMGSVVAETTCQLDNNKELANKIVFIPSADPGFDWLFAHGIAGLITQYGGANSHMAIRAGELGIPSVIGAGEVLYNKWLKAMLLELDAANRKVSILK
jgi:phosphohistidine swiveling domain-containing protein